MSGAGLVFFVVTAAALLAVPRRWAPAPLLAGTCYMTFGQAVLIGPLHFPVFRLLILVGLARVILRREGLGGGMNGLDRLVVIFAAVALLTSRFHQDPAAQLQFASGLAFNTCGTYFLLRIFCQSMSDVRRLAAITLIVLAPVALEMLNEAATGHNLFSVFGGVPESSAIREGRIRAQGPFAHPILAGTVGAVCLPLVAAFWRRSRGIALIGLVSCLVMVVTASSSGPLGTAVVALLGLLLWPWREQMRLFRWGAVLLYVALAMVMKAPPYYLLGRLDLVGGSTGWHRAELIDSSLRHLSEWWLWGTDYTRHWMPTGVSWSPDQTDITNHYLQMGVIGGLPLMCLFIAILAKGFSVVGQRVRAAASPADERFLVWTLGVSLFAHAATCVSVSYFDQSVLFLYLTTAAIGSVAAAVPVPATNPAGRARVRGGREPQRMGREPRRLGLARAHARTER